MSVNQAENAQKPKTKNWFINNDGDITDGQNLIAEPNYINRESHKNAHLLAAAPELLAALEDAVELISCLIGHANDSAGCDFNEDGELYLARKVIAKAKGVA